MTGFVPSESPSLVPSSYLHASSLLALTVPPPLMFPDHGLASPVLSFVCHSTFCSCHSFNNTFHPYRLFHGNSIQQLHRPSGFSPNDFTSDQAGTGKENVLNIATRFWNHNRDTLPTAWHRAFPYSTTSCAYGAFRAGGRGKSRNQEAAKD